MTASITLTPQLIYGFSESMLRGSYDSPKPTPDFHIKLWELFCLPKKYVAIAAPRGHAKSTAITHACTLACVLFRIKQHVVIVSDTESQASAFLGDIKKALMENEELVSLFGVKKFLKDSETEAIVEMDDGYQFRIIARGSEQKLRGMIWRHKRPDLIICDDLENDEIVMNDDRRTKFRDWFYKALMPIGSESCWVRVVGTILHMDSLLARLTPQAEDAYAKVEPLRILDTRKDSSWYSVTYRAHPSIDDFSEILWPELWPISRLKMERQNYIEDGNPEGYTQEYLNQPIDDSKAYFRKEDFLPIPPNAKEPENYYISVDMAISEKKTRAFTVMIVAGMTSTGTIRVREVRRFRGGAYEIVEEILALVQRYNPQLVGIEDENISKAIGPVLDRESYTKGIYVPLKKLPPVKDKMQRARSVQYLMRAGRVQFDVDAEWFHDFRQELVYFPRSTHKDQVDAFAWMGIMLKDMHLAHTEEEIEQMEEEREYDETFAHFDPSPTSIRIGVDPWTGY